MTRAIFVVSPFKSSLPATEILGRIRTTVAIAVLLACASMPFSASANLAQTWSGLGANSNFSTANNWSPTGAPANNGTADLTFSGSTQLSPNVDVPWSVDSINFGTTSGNFTIGGSALTIGAGGITDGSNATSGSPIDRITNSVIDLSASQSWSVTGANPNLFVGSSGSSIVNNGNTVTFSGGGDIAVMSAVSGAGGITVNSGFVDMDEAGHSFTGPFSLNGGQTQIRVASDFGSSSGVINFNGGVASFQLATALVSVNRSVNIESGGAFIAGSQSFGPVFMSSITGPGALTVDHNGSATLAATTNSYSGGTNIDSNGMVICSTSTIQGGVTFNDGYLVFAQNFDGSFNGNIAGTGGGPNAGVSVFGTGVVSLGGANTYTGFTIIGGSQTYTTPPEKTGFLRILNSGALSSNSNVVIAANSALDLNNFNATSADLSGSGSVTLGSGTYTVGADNTTQTYSGSISGTGGFTKVGSGEMMLSGTNSYTGATTINGGTLQADSSTALSASSAVSLANTSGAQFDLNGFSLAVNSLAGGGTNGGNVTLGSGALTVGNNNTASPTYAGVISGTGSLKKIDSDTQILTGANTYSGGTTISAGTLQLGDGLTTNGSLTGSITDSATLAIADPTALSMAGPISGSGVVVKSGAGTLTLTGTELYGGATMVIGGTLNVTGTLVNNGSNKILVNAGTDFTSASIVRNVPAGSSFDGFGSSANGSAARLIGLPADILAGQNNNSSADSLAMEWRVRSVSELPGGSAHPGLISDVLDLTGMSQSTGSNVQTSPFALQMRYTTATLGGNETLSAANGSIYLGWLNPATGLWQNSVGGDFGAGLPGDVFLNVQSSWTTFASAHGITDANVGNFLGSYGVDVFDHEVWAVVNHNSQFAVVPEPSSLVLLAIGVLALGGVAVRRRRAFACRP